MSSLPRKFVPPFTPYPFGLSSDPARQTEAQRAEAIAVGAWVRALPFAPPDVRQRILPRFLADCGLRVLGGRKYLDADRLLAAVRNPHRRSVGLVTHSVPAGELYLEPTLHRILVPVLQQAALGPAAEVLIATASIGVALAGQGLDRDSVERASVGARVARDFCRRHRAAYSDPAFRARLALLDTLGGPSAVLAALLARSA